MMFALKQTLKNGYSFNAFQADLQAGFIVSLIAFPLSMALAITIGLPPQHGIYTAIIAGSFAAFFGGSLYQVSGPTAAFVAILIPIVMEFGLAGMIWCQILAGVFLVLFGILRFGKFIHYVPLPVTIGFTTGISIVLAVICLKDFLGLPIQMAPHFLDKISQIVVALPELNFSEALIGITTLCLILIAKRIKPLPAAAVGMMGATLLSLILSNFGYPVATIGSTFSGISLTLPVFILPEFPKEIISYFKPALMIACLAALESLLSAIIGDNLTQTRHQPNSELKGIGIANIFSALASGIPATAAIARTVTNIQNGARSPFAAIFHAGFILLYVLILSPLINLIPMASLAALLLLTAYNMSHLHQFIGMFKSSPTTDRVVLVTSCVLTVLADMVTGVIAGITIAIFFYLTKKLKKVDLA